MRIMREYRSEAIQDILCSSHAHCTPPHAHLTISGSSFGSSILPMALAVAKRWA
jgi:hypothetical protein